MNKTNVKKLAIVLSVGVLVMLIAMMVSSFAFISNAVKNQAEAEDLTAIYKKCDYDYIINNPSMEQIESFKSASSIEKVVPFYRVVYAVSNGETDYEITIISIDNQDDMKYTEFSLDRRLKDSTVGGNPIYLDYQMMKKAGWKVGNKIGKNKMEFVIAGYYQSYDYDLAYSPSLKEIFGDDITYSGVYVKVADKDAFERDIVANYKPLATLKGRESFSDDEAYERYLEEFYAKDHTSYIKIKDVNRTADEESASLKNKDANKSYLLAGIVAGALVLVGTIAISLFGRRSTKFEIADGGRAKVVARYIISAIINAIIIVAFWLASCAIIANAQDHFISISKVFSMGYLSLILPLIACIVGGVANVLIVRGYKERKK